MKPKRPIGKSIPLRNSTDIGSELNLIPMMMFTDTKPDWGRRGEYQWWLRQPKPKGKPNPLP